MVARLVVKPTLTDKGDTEYSGSLLPYNMAPHIGFFPGLPQCIKLHSQHSESLGPRQKLKPRERKIIARVLIALGSA